MVKQVAFVIPKNIEIGLANGTLFRYGGVIRDAAGRIVMHLPEVPIKKPVEAVANAIPRAQIKAVPGGKVLGFLGRNKYWIGGAAVLLVIGGIAYAVIKNNKKKEEILIPQCFVDYNTALLTYVDAIRKGEMTEDVINNVLFCLSDIKKYQETGNIQGQYTYDNAQLLMEMIRDYTAKFAQENGMDISKEIEGEKVVDLETYLNIQKDIIKKVQ